MALGIDLAKQAKLCYPKKRPETLESGLESFKFGSARYFVEFLDGSRRSTDNTEIIITCSLKNQAHYSP